VSEPDIKQRQLPAADWLERDCLVACPDPEERLVMRDGQDHLPGPAGRGLPEPVYAAPVRDRGRAGGAGVLGVLVAGRASASAIRPWKSGS